MTIVCSIRSISSTSPFDRSSLYKDSGMQVVAHDVFKDSRYRPYFSSLRSFEAFLTTPLSAFEGTAAYPAQSHLSLKLTFWFVSASVSVTAPFVSGCQSNHHCFSLPAIQHPNPFPLQPPSPSPYPHRPTQSTDKDPQRSFPFL